VTREITDDVRRLAKVLWDFHVVADPIDRADFVVALGSHDERVATYAAALVLMKMSPVLVVSGGEGKVTGDLWSDSEAARFAALATSMGVAPDCVLVEPTARNTGENIVNARQTLQEAQLPARTGILVMKPYMARRARATARKQWPSVTWRVAPLPLSFEGYTSDDVPEDRMIDLLVGDLQRLWVYAEQGFQTPEVVPPDVRAAYDELVRRGFDRFVLSE
jgi:uncharacterized SAM-binding protein YcdF (DUF218 family)